MPSWKSLIKMLFDMLKKFFGWCDESSRKRQASELDELDYITPKKARHSFRPMSNQRDIIEIEDDDDDIEIYDDDFQSFQSTSNTSNSSLRHRHTCYSVPSSKNQLSSAKNHFSSAKNHISSSKNHISSSRNHISTKKNPLAMSFARRNPSKPKYTALSRSHQLQDKEEYSKMLQNFLPKVHIIPPTPEARAKPIEIIDIENLEPSTSRVTQRTSWCTPMSHPPRSTLKNRAIEVVKLDDDEESPGVQKPQNAAERGKKHRESIATNSLRDRLSNEPVMKKDYIPRISERYKERVEKKSNEAKELEKIGNLLARHNRLQREVALEEQLTRSMKLYEAVLEEQLEEEEEALPELTEEMMKEVNRALVPRPPDEVLVEGFGLRITRKDISTLSGLNWLNDEVINFYMNLLIERGKEEKFPNVYAMNTFFYPKLLSGGHSMLKRWTRKVDIFAQDIVVVPVHLRLHWCMSIIDFRDKSIRYYDSMGGENHKCLQALRKYLQDESLDKKKTSYDTSDWTLQCMSDIPQQMNGSDCGVFSCTFAEHICANREINFSQDDMPYFRNKMVYEILKSRLL